MKKGYMVGYTFNRYNTLATYVFMVQTPSKKVAQEVVKKWCAFHKKSWSVYRYGRDFTCKITEKNLEKYGNYPCYELSWDRLGGAYRVWETNYFKGAII